MKLLLAALALMLVLEGLPYAAAPGKTRETLAWLAGRPPEVLRAIGLVMVVIGAAALWLMETLGS
jgi:hypothetical protein